MKNNFFSFSVSFLIFAFISYPLFAQTQTFQANKSYQFVNGNWFDGKRFKRKVFYSAGGFFLEKKPSQIDETIDLKNGFIIPPFADAHTHNLDGFYNLEQSINSYLTEGTFYVQVLGNYKTGADQAKKFLNKPTSLDVVYANGALTSTLGHPFMAYEPRALNFYDPATWRENFEKIKKSRIGENNVYWFFDSKEDVDTKFGKFLAQKPDVVKIILIDAERYEALHNNGKAGDKGLSPEVAAYTVEKAHAAGKKVFAHIETANDFRLGLKIGVDVFAHAPGYGWNGDEKTRGDYEITGADLKLAAKKKVVVIPTARIGEFYAGDESIGTFTDSREIRVEKAVERQKVLLNRMKKAGIVVALGSDNFGHFLGEELEYFFKNNFYDSLTLLKIATETTAQTIFPNRKLGRLESGYEASFIVLGGNPLEDFAQTKNINFRFKQGEKITVK